MSSKRKRKKRKLNVAHICPVTPYKCGMYETARELVYAERKLDINAHIVDPRPTEKEIEEIRKQIVAKGAKVKVTCPDCKKDFAAMLPIEARTAQKPRAKSWAEDRGVCNAPKEFAEKSDVIVSHSGLFGPMEKFAPPAVHVAHGWPRSSFLIEWQGGTPIYQEYLRMGKLDRFKAFITFWPEYREYLEVLFPPEKLKVFGAFCDLERWKVEGKEDYDFGGRRGDINVSCGDIWRSTKDPYFLINAFMVFAKQHPDEKVKLHMYGCDQNMQKGWGTLIKVLEQNDWRGEMLPVIKRMEWVYHSSDMMLTSINSASRVVREALACGRQVVAGHDCQWTPYNAYEQDIVGYADAMDLALKEWRLRRDWCIKRNREIAEKNFDVMATARQFVGLFEEITGRKAA